MEDTASPINLSNPFSEYYRIVFNEQQRNFIEQTGKSAGTAVLKTLLEPALEVSDLTNAGRNIILGRNEYPTNMSALGEHVQQGAGTGKALLFVGQNVALTAIGARFPKISIGAGTLYGSHTIVSGIQENNPEKTGEGIAVLGGSTLGGYTYGLGRRFKIEWGDRQPNITSSSAAGQGKSVHTAPATPTQPNRQAQTGVAQGTSQPTTQVKPTAGSGSSAAAGRNTATRAKNSIFDSYPQATTLDLSQKTLQERAQFLSQHIPDLPVAQAKVMLEIGVGSNTSITIGGSRVRGDYTPNSDIDIGFGHLNTNQASKALRRIKRDSAEIPNALKVEDTRIVPGNKTPNIPEIESPKEFFQRRGNRAGKDERAGQPFHPSGSVTIHPNGIIEIDPPRK